MEIFRGYPSYIRSSLFELILKCCQFISGFLSNFDCDKEPDVHDSIFRISIFYDSPLKRGDKGVYKFAATPPTPISIVKAINKRYLICHSRTLLAGIQSPI